MHGSKPIEVPPTDHLILLAGSPDGYRSLSRLVTTAQFRGEKDRPIYLWDDLVELAKTPDIVALSGCHSGEVPGAAARGDLAGAMSAAIRLRELFGSRFHLELWHHGMPEDDPRNDLMLEVAGTSQPADGGHQQRSLPPAVRSRPLRGAGGHRWTTLSRPRRRFPSRHRRAISEEPGRDGGTVPQIRRKPDACTIVKV